MSHQERKPRILVCADLPPKAKETLESVGDVSYRPGIEDDHLNQIISQYDILVVSRAIKVSAETIEHGVHLRMIGTIGAGVDNIDFAAAKSRQIAIVTHPDAHSIAVAEHTLGLILAIARQIPMINRDLKEGQKLPSASMGTGLSGKTLGIIGYGRIGREVARRAQAFGMKILVNQKRNTPQLEMEEVESVDLNDLLQRSDFVSIHVPLRADTKYMIGTKELAKMKKGAYLINTAKREIIEDQPLLEALNAHHLSGIAMDVSPSATDHFDPLLLHPHVIATPHIGSITRDAFLQATLHIAEEIAEFIQGLKFEAVLPLRIIPMSKIFPHESIDQKRVDRLKIRLMEERVLANPPIVTEVENQFMVLDGATRTAAMKQLGFPHAVVQITDQEQGLDLHTWFHVIQGVKGDQLIELLSTLEDISLVPAEADKADEELFEYGALCYLRLNDNRTFLVQPAVGVNRLDALNRLTESYIGNAQVERTLEKDIRILRSEYPTFSGLVVFPEYSVSQVMQVTLSGRYFPAGITRFIIPGRVLRLNMDIDILISNRPLHEKNRWLNQMLEEKVQRNAIRYYREPVYLLDE